MRPAKDFTQSPGAGQGDTDCPQKPGIKKSDGQESTHVMVYSLSKLAASAALWIFTPLKSVPVTIMIKAATIMVLNEPIAVSTLLPADILFLQPFIHHRALMEKYHPGSNGSTDVSHQKKEEVIGKSPLEIGYKALAKDIRN